MRLPNLRWQLTGIVTLLGVLSLVASALVLHPAAVRAGEQARLRSFSSFLGDFQETVQMESVVHGQQDEQLANLFNSRAFHEDLNVLVLVRGSQVAVSMDQTQVGRAAESVLDAEIRAPVLAAMKAARPGAPQLFPSPGHQAWAMVRLPVADPQFLIARLNLAPARALALHNSERNLLWHGLVLILALVCVDFFFSRRVLRRVADMNNQVQNSPSGVLKLPALAAGSDEIAQLARTLQEMSGRVHDAERRLRTLLVELESRIELRTAELEAARNQADAASRAKSAFLASMSHEIRTPLNGVLGMAELMATSKLDAEQRRWLDTLHVSGQTLLGIINDVLDLSKIESGQQVLENKPLVLSDELDAVARPLALKAAEKGVALRHSSAPGTPAVVVGDALRLRQILTNLIGNAVKFTDHGSVEVMVRPGSGVAADAAPDYLHFSIRDTGIGIAPDMLANLFQPFVQADASITRRFGGTGLGLSIARRLAEQMGGRLWAESVPGRGSVFHAVLRLPATTQVPAATSTAGVCPLHQTRPRRVLLVEDNRVNQQVATTLLRRRGHEVVVANHGAEALAALTQGAFDLVLMDVQMPVMDGLEATRQLRVRESAMGGPRLRVVAMTASAMGEDRDQCLAAGMDGFIAKPFRAGELYSAVEHEAFLSA